MTRNTHDIVNDHFGTAKAEQIASGTATSGYIPVSTGAGAAAAWTAMAPSGGLIELVTGNSSTFAASNGSWTASAGTMTWDNTYQMTAAPGGSLKWVNTGTGYLELSITGTFEAAKDYWAVVFLSWEDTDAANKSFYVRLGDSGASDYTDLASFVPAISGAPWIGNAAFMAVAVHWVPSANRTSVSVRVASTSTSTLHVGMLRAWQTPVIGAMQVWGETYLPFAGDSSSVIGPWGSSPSDGSLAWSMNGRIGLAGVIGKTGIVLSDVSNRYLYFWSEHAAADLSYEGHEFDVGDDYLALYFSEKSNTTYQLYGYDDQNFELRDLGTGHWFVTNPGDTLSKNLIEMEQRKASGTATVASGTTSISVTHGAGYTPVAADLVVTPTNNPTNDPGWFWINNVGATTFDINVRNDPGSGGATFSWRVDR